MRCPVYVHHYTSDRRMFSSLETHLVLLHNPSEANHELSDEFREHRQEGGEVGEGGRREGGGELPEG